MKKSSACATGSAGAPTGSRSPTGNWTRAAFRNFRWSTTPTRLYPRITNVKYPKVGEKNAACRVGVVSAGGGETRWIDVPGDPRDNYIAYLEWAGNSHELVLQQFNRRQDTVRVILISVPAPRRLDPRSSISRDYLVTLILEDHDDAWIDLQEELHWIHDDREFLWLSERDGWRHIYRVSRDGKSREGNALRRVTTRRFRRDRNRRRRPGSRLGVLHGLSQERDPALSLPHQARRAAASSGSRPRGSPARTTTSFRPTRNGRFTGHSAFDVVPTTALIRLPKHENVRVLAESKELREKLDKLEQRALGVLSRRYRQWHRTRRLVPVAAEVRFDREIPAAGARLRRARGPDGRSTAGEDQTISGTGCWLRMVTS